MSIVEDLEKAIAQLPPDELAAFRLWFEAFDAAAFDSKIAQDASSGKLDDLAEQALIAHRHGRTQEL